MNALVRKEIRLVLPFWIAAMVLAVFPVWLLWPGQQAEFLQPPGNIVQESYLLGVILLGLAPFGQELSLGTFSILLAQPTSRERLWRAKTTILLAALGLVFAAFYLSNHIRSELVIGSAQSGEWQRLPGEWHRLPANRFTDAQLANQMAELRVHVLRMSLMGGGLWALAAFGGGLWANLLFRNASAAFWSSLIAPLGLGLLAGRLLSGLSERMGGGPL